MENLQGQSISKGCSYCTGEYNFFSVLNWAILRAVFLQMLLPTVVILKHTKKEFICSPISAYFGGLIAFKKKQQRLTLAQKNKVQKCALQNRLRCRNTEWLPIGKRMVSRTGKCLSREYGKGYWISNNKLLWFVLRNYGKKGHIQGWPYQPHYFGNINFSGPSHLCF